MKTDSIGKKIKSLRENSGLEAQKLASELSVGKSTLSNWENDRRTPDTDTLIKIANYFKVSVDYLLGRTDERNLNKEKPKLDEGIKTIAAHKVNINEDLPDEAIEKINDYIKMVEMMYKNKDK